MYEYIVRTLVGMKKIIIRREKGNNFANKTKLKKYHVMRTIHIAISWIFISRPLLLDVCVILISHRFRKCGAITRRQTVECRSLLAICSP